MRSREVKTAADVNNSGRDIKICGTGYPIRVYLTMAGAPLHDTEKFKDALEYAKKIKESNEHALNPNYHRIFINECQDIEDYKECIWRQNVMAPTRTSIVKAAGSGNENGVLCRANSFSIVGYAYGFNSTTYKLFNLYSCCRRCAETGPYLLIPWIRPG